MAKKTTKKQLTPVEKACRVLAGAGLPWSYANRLNEQEISDLLEIASKEPSCIEAVKQWQAAKDAADAKQKRNDTSSEAAVEDA